MSKTEKDLKKEREIHKQSYFMYEKTKKEVEERMYEAMNPDGSKKYNQEQINERLNMIQIMQDDIKEKFLYCNGDINELNNPIEKKETKRKKISKEPITERIKKDDIKITPKKEELFVRNNSEELYNYNAEKNNELFSKNRENTTKFTDVYNGTPVVSENWMSNNFNESFDVIPLPSKGECYDNHMSTIAVSYLTANDENMIVSPNLYRDGLILDYLLKAKIKNDGINPDDLLDGDRDAIILWLRATSYGTKYPITVTDNKTGVNFDTVVDLTQIKHKPFTLKGDENGYFDYMLPVSKDEVKFRFLTHGDNKKIERLEQEEQNNVKKQRLLNIVEELNGFIENDTDLTKDEKLKLYEAKRNINKWAEIIDTDNDLGYTHKLTNKLELSIVSINGNKDREYISNYVENMNVMDALQIRRYIYENEPGLDYSVTVERPESLGGGSMNVFLALDEYVFLNIA